LPIRSPLRRNSGTSLGSLILGRVMSGQSTTPVLVLARPEIPLDENTVSQKELMGCLPAMPSILVLGLHLFKEQVRTRRRKKMKNGLLLFLILLSLSLSACSEKATPEPVVVHIFRDRAAAEINSALLAIGAKQLRTPNGQPIMIATTEVKYADGLEILGRHDHPDLIIFNSPEDGKRTNIDVPPQSAVQVSTKRFYLVIPSWVSGEQRETAELVLAEFRRELRRADAAASSPSH
jgi:hypothetical protein